MWFQIYEFLGRDRETVAAVAYFVAFALLISSGVAELSVDACGQRRVSRGRYHGDDTRWNVVLSCCFVFAGIAGVVVFVC